MPRDEALKRIKPILNDLFEQADPAQAAGQKIESDDDICPLYCAISRIENRYQNPELIGRGGMKEVYRVYDARATRHVAMAKPLPEFNSDQFDAFLREAHLTARLDHPNIIDMFDMDLDEQGRPFFTMQLKQGRSLRAVINLLRSGEGETAYSLRDRLEIFSRVCDAIAYAHSRQVLHLDIKPENVFVGEFGEVKVCDWGMGVVMSQTEGQSPSTVLLDPDLYGSLLESAKGTPIYMAPEQKEKRRHKTPQMDIYALGCLLHELLTFELPVRVRSGNSKIGLALAATIAKATAHDPADRYQTVEDLRQDIARFLAGYSVSVEQAGLRREAALFYRRHREACAITLGLLTVLSLCVFFFVMQLRESRADALDAMAAAVAARGHSQEAQLRAENAQERTKRALISAEEAQSRAEEAQTRAEQAQSRAEESLAKYLAEKAESERRRDRQVSEAVLHAELLTDIAFLRDETLPLAFQHTNQHLDSILSFNPPPQSHAWTQKYWLHFLTQDFESALQLVRDGKIIQPDLVRLARKYQPHVGPNGRLDTDHFIQLVRDLSRNEPWRAPLAEKMLVYDNLTPRPADDQTRLVREWIEINNPECENLQLDFNAETETVRLRSTGVTQLLRTIASTNYQPSRICLLQTLRPRVLDLRGTNIHDLSQLRSLELIELDLRGTPITDLSPLKGNRMLRRLYVSPDQFTESDMEALPKSIEVIVGDE
ncbi:serine/threonine-protein kinase [Rhodopirellula sallentina SM41]|uniref:Serine/threonine-protein kinase n=1 Tax=Rhodopirellula sallentina SM41 TaxID=1263870 RepID=M5TW24_9BACT|nr:serine/threonine-protein kinase [Rhodopirellula sallentina SM41]